MARQMAQPKQRVARRSFNSYEIFPVTSNNRENCGGERFAHDCLHRHFYAAFGNSRTSPSSAADVELAGEERVNVDLGEEARIPREAVLEAAKREAVARGLLLV